jgi:hypothetical protein
MGIIVGVRLRYLLFLAQDVLLLIIIFLLAVAELILALHIAGHGPKHRIHNSLVICPPSQDNQT